MLIAERYASAIHSGNLAVSSRTASSPTDILAAAGAATRERPLASILLRWFAGDYNVLYDLAALSTQMLTTKAWHKSKVKLRRPQAERIVSDVLVWYWVSTCAFCKGRGYKVISGSPHLSDKLCPGCGGRGRKLAEVDFGKYHDLASWLIQEYEREHGLALAKMGVAIRKNL
jgi:hypothetical protein